MSSEFTTRQFQLAYPDGIEHQWWSLARSRVVARLLERSSVVGPVLEVGCGRGVAVKNLRDRGIDAQGVELAEIEPLPGVTAYVQSGTDARSLTLAQRERFRSLLLLDVIEHLETPCEFVRELLASFPCLEQLVITVPAGASLWSNYDEYYGHHRRYSLAMLEQLGQQLGLSIGSRQYFFHSLYPPARLLALLGMQRATQLSAPAPGGLWWHKALAGLMGMDARWLPAGLPGTSAVACYRISG